MISKEFLTKIFVKLDFGRENKRDVGTLAYGREGKIYFEFSHSFLENPLPISPFHLPIQSGILGPFDFEVDKIKGLPGVFYDSLPDGWGRLLLDRFVQTEKIDKSTLTPLDRLAFVGINGMGALTYEPDHSEKESSGKEVNLKNIFENIQAVLEDYPEAVLNELLALNGSSHGARPKAMVDLDLKTGKMRYGSSQPLENYEPWIIKFPNSQDRKEAGLEEYLYALMAQKAGIEMPPVQLFRPKEGGDSGFFAVKRFDRQGAERFHMQSAAGLLNMNFRADFLDYTDLISLAFQMTQNPQEIQKLYRLAVFNVLAHNQDDHAKNFSFLMDETGKWQLSPAYDLTFSNGLGGYQSSSVCGKNINLNKEDLKKLGQHIHLQDAEIKETLEQVQEALSDFPALAKNYGLPQKRISEIQTKITP